MEPPDPEHPSRPPDRTEHTVLLILRRLIELIEKLLVALSDRWVLISGIGAIVVMYGVTMVTVPPQDRLRAVGEFAGSATEIRTLVTSDLSTWGGWALAVLLLLAGGPYVLVQHKRIQKQGTELARYRDQEVQGRLTSRAPETLAQYPENAKRRFSKDSDP